MSFCYEYPPLAFLFGHITTSCDGTFVLTGRSWVQDFTGPELAIPVLSQAAFLANQALFEIGPMATNVRLYIWNLPNLPMAKPEISAPATIGLSVLIAVYLLMLTCLCVLSITQAPWAGSLNGYAILKMTAALCSSSSSDSDVDQRLTQKTYDIFDTLPGHVGDAEPDASVGRLAVGAEAPLKWRRRYWKRSRFAL